MSTTAPDTLARTLWVDQNHPRAIDAVDAPDAPNAGDREAPFATISQAAFFAQPGDTVHVMPGIYRERVAPRRSGEPGKPITYRAQPGGSVIIRGSEPFQPDWQPVPGLDHAVTAALDPALFEVDQRQAVDWPQADFPTHYNPFALPLSDAALLKGPGVDIFGDVQSDAAEDTARRITLGEVFVDGQPLTQLPDSAAVDATPGSYTVMGRADDQGRGLRLVVHWPIAVADPIDHLVEITTRPRCFAPYRRGLSHISVRGFVMEHAAVDFHRGFYSHKSPQAGVLSTRGGTHWTIEHNVIRWGTNLGIDIGTEGDNDADGLGQPEPRRAGHHLIRFNTITDHGSGGIQGINAPHTIISHNVIERTNRLGFSAPEVGAIKLHFFVDGVIEHNLIRDNDCFGIWLDNVWHRSRVHGNLLANNQGAGLFIEMGHGPLLVDHNIIAQTRAASTTSGLGDGVYAHDASAVTFAHNLTFFNAGHGLYTHLATDRRPHVFRDGARTGERRPSASSFWRIHANLFIGDSLAAIALPPQSEYSEDNRSDFNGFAGTLPPDSGETYAAALRPPRFAIVHNKGRTDLEPHLRAAGVDPEAYREHHQINLRQWQAVTGGDRHSRRLTVLRPMYNNRSMILALSVGPTLLEIQPPTPPGGLDPRLQPVDYLGLNRPADRPALPGPFARLPIHPELLPEAQLDPDQFIKGRGPFNKTDASRHFQACLWPKPQAARDRLQNPHESDRP